MWCLNMVAFGWLTIQMQEYGRNEKAKEGASADTQRAIKKLPPWTYGTVSSEQEGL